MSDPCRNDCPEPLGFPKRLFNRPGLSQIDYRIGTYADIRAALLRQLDADPMLQAWTHREADDPGIALLEGAAILGDILTFYQNLYANEAYLRTAQWRESVADLVRLLGYRLSPGLGGKATFAVGSKGTTPVVVPAGFGLKAQVEGLAKTADFQTTAAVTAYHHLSEFRLYRPRKSPQSIQAGGNRLEVAAVGGKGDVASLQALNLQKGDRLMLLPMSETTASNAEILIISKVEQHLDRKIIEFEGSLTVNRGKTVTAYRLGRSFNHFGQTAPNLITRLNTANPPQVTQTPTSWLRRVDNTFFPGASDTNYYPSLLPKQMPFDSQTEDLAVGNSLICQGIFVGFGFPFIFPFTVFRTIDHLQTDALVWGNLSGATTIAVLNNNLILNTDSAALWPFVDIRKLKFHEVKSPEIKLRALTQWSNGALADTDGTLNFWGTYDQALTLANRLLVLQKNDGTSQLTTVTTSNTSFSLTNRDTLHSWLWPVQLSQTGEFSLEDFDELDPTVTVYGNLVEATQGKLEKEAVLGNGDGREIFQTFKLPKAPLTYFAATGETPPEVPELEIFVSDRRWTRVQSLFGQSPQAEVYIVREDANGESWVQFGDGKTGARLPSGVKNVKALYRTGTGAFGSLKPETKVQASSRLTGLDQLWLPGVASGGTEPESGDHAKQAAPGKVQSLGRLVSLQDFETETLSIGGVSKATAAWQLVDNLPSVVLTVLMETGREKELAEVQAILNAYNRCRGPQRFPILVKPGQVRYLYLRLVASLHPAFRQARLSQAIHTALGISGPSGLLSFSQRRFGQREYATRIEATVQQVEGVVWSRVQALGWFPPNDKSAELAYPNPEADLAVVPCGADQVLTLLPQHVQLQFAAAPQEDC